MTEQIPSEKGPVARIALAVLAGALGTSLVAGGLWLALRPAPQPSSSQREIDPAEETKPETITVPGSGEQTPSPAPDPSENDTEGADQPGNGSSSGGKAAQGTGRLVFRREGKLWVAAENGSDARPVTYGFRVYALSPNGKTLAVISDLSEPLAPQSSLKDVRLLDVRRRMLDAVSDTPSWAGTSSWLAFTAQVGESVVPHRIDVNGSGIRSMRIPGSSPKASRDGELLCFLDGRPAGQAPLVVVKAAGDGATKVGESEGAASWAWGKDNRLFFVTAGTARGTWEIRESAPPFTTSRRLGSLDLAAPAFALHDLHVSPNGRAVLMSSLGDDQFSRLWIFNVRTARFHTISTRRDAYPYGWTSDGSRIIYFEGNSYQGEPSSLMSCRADGSGRRILIEGAAR